MINRVSRSIASLVLVFFIASVPAQVLAAKNPAPHIAKAKQAFKQAKFAVAFEQLKKALKLAPNNVEANLLMARLAERSGNARGAAALYQKVAKLDRKNVFARAKMATFFLQLYSVANNKKFLLRAGKYSDELLKLNPKDVNGLAVRAAIRAYAGKMDEALKLAEKALSINSTHYFAIVTKVNVLFARKKADDAIALLKQAIAKSKRPVQLVRQLVRVRLRQQKPGLAITELEQLTARHSGSPRLLIDLIELYVQSGQKDKARNTYQKLLKLQPKNIKLKGTYVVFLARFFGEKTAMAQLEKYIAATPGKVALKLQKAALLIRFGKGKQAAPVLKAIISKYKGKAPAVLARLQFATLLASQGDLNKADQQVSSLLKKRPKFIRALMLKARIAMHRRKPQEAAELYKTVLAIKPKYPAAFRNLAVLYQLSGNFGAAVKTLQLAIEKNPANLQFRAMLARLYLRVKKPAEATKQFDSVLKISPRNRAALQAIFEIRLRARDYKGANATAAKIMKFYPKLASGPYLMGIAAQAANRHKEAIAHFEKSLKMDNRIYYPIAAMARSLVKLGKVDKAIERVSSVIAKNPGNTAAITLLGRLYLKSKNRDKAEQALKKAIKAKPKHLAGYHNLAGFYIAFNKNAEAVKTLKAGLKVAPGNPGFSFLLASVYQRSGKKTDAVTLYDSLLKKNPGHVAAANNLALLLVNQGGKKADIARAMKLVSKFGSSNNPYLLDTFGWVSYKAGKLDDAVTALGKAMKLLPKDAEIQYHLGMAQFRKKNVAAAKKYLKLAVSSKQQFTGKAEARTTLSKLGK